jgi:hypothetical protein
LNDELEDLELNEGFYADGCNKNIYFELSQLTRELFSWGQKLNPPENLQLVAYRSSKKEVMCNAIEVQLGRTVKLVWTWNDEITNS